MEMRSKLPPQFYVALEIRRPLKGWAIHSAVLELMGFYHDHFDMVFPTLNTPLLLFKHIRNLGLPSTYALLSLRCLTDSTLVEIYPAVKRLAALLHMDFEHPVPQRGTRHSISYPEIRLMSLIVVATKLSHPFDDISRYSVGESDPSTVQIDWTKWTQIMAEPPKDGLKRGEEIHVTDEDVLSMSEKAMDNYLDWYQGNWIDDRPPKSIQSICFGETILTTCSYRANTRALSSGGGTPTHDRRAG